MFPNAITSRAAVADCLESCLFLDSERYTRLKAIGADGCKLVRPRRSRCGETPDVMAVGTTKGQLFVVGGVHYFDRIAARGTPNANRSSPFGLSTRRRSSFGRHTDEGANGLPDSSSPRLPYGIGRALKGRRATRRIGSAGPDDGVFTLNWTTHGHWSTVSDSSVVVTVQVAWHFTQR